MPDPAPSLLTVRPPKKRSMLKSAARVGATLVGARVAAATGKKGVFGLLAGAGARRLIMRYPAGALFVTGAYMAGKLYEAKREADRKGKVKPIADKSARPILVDKAGKTPKG